MKSIIFLGPTLPLEQAKEVLNADYRPPVSLGDIYDAVVNDKPDVIGIIDGYFNNVPAVWHKEILFALSNNVQVMGSSSMGALRAAELYQFGMQGVGWVFEKYHNGVLEDDDEVAIIHGPKELKYLSISTAMVNIREGLLRAYNIGLIEEKDFNNLIAISKKHYYQVRSWSRLYNDIQQYGFEGNIANELVNFLELEKPDIKRDDALLLLKNISDLKKTDSHNKFFVKTIFWEKLVEQQKKLKHSNVNDNSYEAFLKCNEPNIQELVNKSLLYHLVEKECRIMNNFPTKEDIEATIQDFRIRENLLSKEQMNDWLEISQLTNSQFYFIMKFEAMLSMVLHRCSGDVSEKLVDINSVFNKSNTNRKHYDIISLNLGSPIDKKSHSFKDVERYFRELVNNNIGLLSIHAKRLGFSTKEEFIDQVRYFYQEDLNNRNKSNGN